MDCKTPVFDIATFRIRYPIFSAVADETINVLSGDAYPLVPTTCGCNTERLWQLLTAHMLSLYLSQLNGSGGASGAVASATIDKVSVSFVAPTSSGALSHWLNLSPYGQQYAAMVVSVCGGRRAKMVGGAPERAAFKVVGGRYPNGGRSW